jgi:hypothetical protein
MPVNMKGFFVAFNYFRIAIAKPGILRIFPLVIDPKKAIESTLKDIPKPAKMVLFRDNVKEIKGPLADFLKSHVKSTH